MAYKYITQDNLEQIQDYQYTEYEGLPFLESYFESRKGFLCRRGGDLPALIRSMFQEPAPSKTTAQLLQLWEALQRDAGGVCREGLDLFVKRFEVRKRLFAEYELRKPVLESGYRDIRNYILLSAATEQAYSKFQRFPYLNCLLKVNDTLLSLAPGLTGQQSAVVKELVTREVEHITQLMHKKHIKGA